MNESGSGAKATKRIIKNSFKFDYQKRTNLSKHWRQLVNATVTYTLAYRDDSRNLLSRMLLITIHES